MTMKQMTTMAAAALLLTILHAPAHAENWKRIDVTDNGTIMEADLDSIHKYPNGVIAVTVSPMGRLFFDCKGHFGQHINDMSHIPTGSIADEAADTVCDSKE
jgi:hypothetical protein